MSQQRLNIATLFTGGGIAFSRLRCKHNFVFACEYDAKIAAMYKLNYAGSNCFVGRVQDVTPAMLIGKQAIDILQASPVCKEFSTAKVGGTESQEEISQAHAISDILQWLTPRYFLLENVWQYREATSFKLILNRLDALGYHYEYRHINCADYGVPQTRKRLILLASRTDQSAWKFPEPTHEPDPAPTLWGTKERWVSWYEAIEDLIPTLPESSFAKWQLDRLPSELKETLLVGKEKSGIDTVMNRQQNDPAFTITASAKQELRAYLVDAANSSKSRLTRDQTEPSFVNTTAYKNVARVFLADCTHQTGRDMTIRMQDEPNYTIVSSMARRPASEPRANLNGKVVKLTPRALARLMSVPDDYALPEKAGLACTILGNGIPSLLIEKLVDALPIPSSAQEAA